MATQKTSLGGNENLMGAVCYLGGFITGIIFILLEKKNEFIRFHAMQSTITFGGLAILQIVLGVIPVLGWILIPFTHILGIVLWIFLMVKAYQGEKYKLPYIGDIAIDQLKKM